MIKRLFSHPVVQKLAALIFSGIFRLWMGTLSLRLWMPTRQSNPAWAPSPTLYVLWHESLMLPSYTHSRFNCCTLISRHRDGELLAQMLRMLRATAIRGSTTRDSLSALRQMIRRSSGCHMVLAPDGPRGPRRVFQPGAVYLASRTGLPIVPVACAVDRFWRLGSWDRMLIPKPFARAVMVSGEPVFVPPDASRQQLEHYRLHMEAAMNQLQQWAEDLLAGRARQDGMVGLQRAQDRSGPLTALP